MEETPTTRLDSRRPQSSSDQNGGPVAVNESIANEGVGVGQPVPMIGRIQSQLSTSLTATAAADEMGAHFAACGRYLTACVACVLPQFEGDSISGVQSQLHHQEGKGPGTSPTCHPISARQVIYELRIYSLHEAT
ncbi:unnamed protein product [Lactuca saligna]|uniref:Uncharacterized protein n=1 Tax=Lactuca saligna TaxID=75948 RepID=A0AA35V4K8_LACSI|nr:unnamed protein product [Lactuca saligna]